MVQYPNHVEIVAEEHLQRSDWIVYLEIELSVIFHAFRSLH